VVVVEFFNQGVKVKKFLVIAIIVVAFLITLKLAAAFLFWGLTLLIHWGALVVILGALLYFSLRSSKNKGGGDN
jgi:hypothetical protein